jgi:hypothetical protein
MQPCLTKRPGLVVGAATTEWAPCRACLAPIDARRSGSRLIETQPGCRLDLKMDRMTISEGYDFITVKYAACTLACCLDPAALLRGESLWDYAA